MRRSPWRAATSSSALLTTVALFAASMNTFTTTTAQSSHSNNNCVPYNSSSTAGNLEDNLIAVPTYFGCGNDGFLVAVEASYISAVKSLLWTCSDSAVVGSTSSGSFADDPVSFTVGITQVQTKVEDSSVGFLSDMYIGGYDVDSSWTDIVFSWKGPFGLDNAGDVLLPDASFSTCAAGSFATGVTVWSSTNFVYGVILECADVTASCAPPDYPANLLEDDSGSTSTSLSDGSRSAPPADDSSSSDSSSLVIIISVAVGAGLLLLGIIIGGVACCLCRSNRERDARLREKTQQTPDAVSVTAAEARGEGDASVTNEEMGTTKYADQDIPRPLVYAPQAYVKPTYSQDSEPPPYCP